MSDKPERKSVIFPVEDPLSAEAKRSPGWLSKLVPRWLALRALEVDLRAPETVIPGEPATFRVSIRNRLPVAVAVQVPTSRVWGWAVDGIPEADERGLEPPAESRPVAFGARERRVFEGRWDGTIRRRGFDGDVWDPCAGTVALSAFLAVRDPERQGVSASATVSVEPSPGGSTDWSRP